MTQGDEMAEVTEGDRERAVEVADAAEYRGRKVLENAIAAALAEERQKARAPFLALAKEMAAADFTTKIGAHSIEIAERIRRASEVSA